MPVLKRDTQTHVSEISKVYFHLYWQFDLTIFLKCGHRKYSADVNGSIRIC